MASKKRIKQAFNLLILVIFAYLLLAGTRSGQAVNSVITSTDQLPSQKSPNSNLGADREAALNQLYAQLRSGAVFTAEETDILTRFANGKAISEIEADIVISRVLYLCNTLGRTASPEQTELLLRYKEFIAGGAKPNGPLVGPTCASCGNYTFTQASGAAIVPGTSDSGNHCDDCTTPITLPFPYMLYDQTFTAARVSSNGNLQFTGNHGDFGGCIPMSGYRYTIFAFHSDLYTGDTGSGQGVFTSVSGTAPHRIFNIEWRTRFCCASGVPNQNFEIRLYEGQQRFDIIYGQITSSFVSVGVQRDTNCFTQYECNSANTLSPGLQLTFSTACMAVNCPADITVGAFRCPASGGSVVSFASPTSIGDCGAVTCSPASGSFFPIGTTTVACSTAGGFSCSFKVTVTGNCLQDDSDPSKSVAFDPQTGSYTFCCGGVTFSGTGTAIVKGCVVTIQHATTDRRVLITFDGSTNAGTASLQFPPGTMRCVITDRNTADDHCDCH
ncbi:MAG TPA: hypothetical protein VKA60_18060 [Blastocatellia bacterium]|nr:hypothetical protein [Blastocatellia bacterium]